MSLPAHITSLYSEADIRTALGALAPQLDAWANEAEADTGRLLMVVCMLRGGVFFFGDLLLTMNKSVEPGFCRAWSYAKQANGQPEATVRMDWQDLIVKDRDVVLVDNICDSGRTLNVASEWLAVWGARKVRTAVIVHRLRADSRHTPTITGFVYPGAEWLVGYGLRDSDSKLMNTRAIGLIPGTHH